MFESETVGPCLFRRRGGMAPPGPVSGYAPDQIWMNSKAFLIDFEYWFQNSWFLIAESLQSKTIVVSKLSTN